MIANSMKSLGQCLIAGLLLSAPALSLATPLNIAFNQPVGATNGNGTFGPFYKANTLSFSNVTTTGGHSIDARITATTWGVTSLGINPNSGLYGNYSNGASEPNGDAAIYFTADAKGLGGVHYDVEFFLSGTTTPYTLGEFNLMLYDVDGDNRNGVVWQQEQAKAYLADGLTGYRLLSGDSQLQPSLFDGGVNFLGTSVNWPELNANGAVVLNYQNTSKLRLDYYAYTYDGIPNGSFIGLDGDMSYAGGDFTGFAPIVPVPEPGVTGLLGGALLLGLATRRRRRA